MAERPTVALHHGIRAYSDVLDNVHGVMRAFAKKTTPWEEN